MKYYNTQVDQVDYQSHQVYNQINQTNHFHVNQPDYVNPPPYQPDQVYNQPNQVYNHPNQATQFYYSQPNYVNKEVKESHDPLKHTIITITILKHFCCQVNLKESLLRRNEIFV